MHCFVKVPMDGMMKAVGSKDGCCQACFTGDYPLSVDLILPRLAEKTASGDPMNILLIGSGAREHAIAWKVSQSPKLSKLFTIPGNPGTGLLGENVSAISVDDHPAVIKFCRDKQIDLVLVGPEAPLAAGLADALTEAGIRCFGPRKAAARIE
jgi:hypothetical protein